MVRSMTGYCSRVIELPVTDSENIFLSLEIKSLNTRFFEGSCRIPGGLSHIEHKILSLLKKEFIRGRIYLTIKTIGESSSFENVVPALKIVDGYKKSIERIREEYGIQGDVELSNIIGLQGVFSFEKAAMTSKQEGFFFKELAAAIADLNGTRDQEGTQILQDLKTIFTRCEQNIKQVSEAYTKSIEKKKTEVHEQAQRSEQGDLQAAASLEEAYRMLDKIDIHEEVSRFENHLKTVIKLIESENPEKGRRLDFMMQELMREVNTMTAKCSDYDISSTSVDIKVDIEKAREQIQNIV